MKSTAEIKQTVIAILTSVRGGQAGSDAELFTVPGPAGGNGPEHSSQPAGSVRPHSPAAAEAPAAPEPAEQARRQALTAATYAMTLFHMLAAEFEAACPGVDVQAFLRRRALEVATGDDEAA